MNKEQINGLLYEALETEMGGIQVYETAISCAQNEELREEWEKYLDETRTHEEILQEVFAQLGLDPGKETPGRKVVRHLGQSLVQAMTMAKSEAPPAVAEIVAAECVVLAETKDHQNWELIGKVAEKMKGKEREVLSQAHEQVEEQEDMHLYHTRGWARELWIKSLGMPAVLPPPEEEKKVTTAIGAARAEKARSEMLKK